MENRTNWWMIVAILAIVLLLFSGSGMMSSGWCGGRSGYNSYSNYGMMSWMFGNPFGWVFGMLAMIIFWGLAIVILVYFIKMISGSLDQQKSHKGSKNGKR